MLAASSRANALSDLELKGIFEQIDSGPDIEAYKQWLGGKVTEEQIEDRRGYFFTKQMYPFEPVLARLPSYSGKYQALVEKHGVRSLADYFRFSEAKVFRIEPKSPISSDELAAKSNEELLTFLGDWKPRKDRNDIDSPSVSGLSEIFSGLVKKQPERFLGIADQLKRPPTYVRDFLYYVKDVAKRREVLPWEKIVQLCEWIVIQPNERPT